MNGTGNGILFQYKQTKSEWYETPVAWGPDYPLSQLPSKLKASITGQNMHDKEALNKMSY